VDVSKDRVVTISTLCLLDDDGQKRVDSVVAQVREAGARQRHDLIVTPLMPFVTFGEATAAEDLAEFAEAAAEMKTYLAVAGVERAAGEGRAAAEQRHERREVNGRMFLTSVLFDREGKIAGRYRKTHALADDDVALGDSLSPIETDFGKIGFSLGTDFYFPEVYWTEALEGADVLVWQHYPERFREHFQWPPMLLSRSLDAHCHLVTSMYADPRCYIASRYKMGMQGAAWGRSMILNRVGTTIADTGYEDGIASATVNLDKRKVDPYPGYEAENIFFVNCMGDRKAFAPVTEPYDAPTLPNFGKRTARIAVGTFWDLDQWQAESVPERMLKLLEEAGEHNPDVVLLSEMGAREETPHLRKTMARVGECAREMESYILIGGLDDKGERSHGWLWDRKGDLVFREPIYWTQGFPEIQVFDADFARVGIHVCGDLYMGEIDRVLALKGAEIILDPSKMWGADGHTNEMMLRSRAIDNGVWMACSHWNSSDPGLRSVVIDPYGQVMGASYFQTESVFSVDIDFEERKVFYEGKKAEQPTPGDVGIEAYVTGDIPEQKAGWREMIFAHRRPELYGVLPGHNEVTERYRPSQWDSPR
jgi:predicted amidohydrolase